MKQDELFRLYPERKHPKPPPKTMKLTRTNPKEAPILASVLQALWFYPNVEWFERMNTGAYVAGEAKKRRFIRFGFKGLSDIIGQLKPRRAGEPGAWLAIECKRVGENPTEDQQAFLDRINKNGGCAFVARNIDDLKQHLGGNHV